MTGRRSWIAYAAVCAPLVLLLAVTVMTWRTEQGFRRVSDRVVHDYAAIAAWQLARRASTALHDEVMAAFGGIAPGHMRTGPGAPLVPPQRLLDARDESSSAFLRQASLAVTREGDSLALAGEPLDVDGRLLLERRLEAFTGGMRADAEPHHMLFDVIGGRSRAIALWAIGGRDGSHRVYGVVSSPEALHTRLAALLEQGGLLPATSGMPRALERDLAVRITRPDGAVVFETSSAIGATAATDSTGLQNGELHVTVDLTPAMAGALLAAAPRSRVPALLLMLLLSVGLAVLGVRHERRARELEELRTRFVANVSHELRTPLTQISMFAETLALGRERPEERRHFAGIIHAEALRLSTLVATVLRHSRGERARQPLRAEVVSLREEVERAVETYEPLARVADATVTVNAAEVAIAIDRESLRQVLLNLLDNAVKHGGRAVHVLVSVSAEGGEARITVDDSGPGIPDAWRERVFEAFVRVDESRSTGAGIGLSVVRELVTAHGGRVWVERSPLGGARFTVVLPAMTAASAEAAPPSPAHVSS